MAVRQIRAEAAQSRPLRAHSLKACPWHVQPENGELSLSDPDAAAANESPGGVERLSQASQDASDAHMSHTEATAAQAERARDVTTSCTSLGRGELRDRAEGSGWTAVGAAVAPAPSRRASAPLTLRHYLAQRRRSVFSRSSAAATRAPSRR